MMNSLLMILFATVINSMRNGSPIRPREFTYIVSVQKANVHACTGVIIHEAHVMTIAHMVITVSAVELQVIGGMNTLIAPRIPQHKVKEIYIHPNFEIQFLETHGEIYHQDIAVLRLQEKVNWLPALAPLPLENAEYNWNDPLDCVLISWDIPRDRRLAMILTWEFIKVKSDEVHPGWATLLGEHKKFFNDFFGTAAISEEDLGSPIVCGNFMRGIVAQGELRTIQEKPSVLISIAPYLGFIQEIVQDGLYFVESVKYPYVASIWSIHTHVCGGFIIDATHIATAGHCVAHNEAFNYLVGVGYSGISQQWLRISNITIHPGYKIGSTHQLPMWYIDHDFAIITTMGMISWRKSVRPLALPTSNDLHEGEICEVLRWNCHRDEKHDVDVIKLTSSRVVLVDECSQLLLDPSTQLQVPSFWGRTPHLMPIASFRDVGNPIICNGNAVGFLIQAVPTYGDFFARAAKFLRIRPYMEFSWNMFKQNE